MTFSRPLRMSWLIVGIRTFRNNRTIWSNPPARKGNLHEGRAIILSKFAESSAVRRNRAPGSLLGLTVDFVALLASMPAKTLAKKKPAARKAAPKAAKPNGVKKNGVHKNGATAPAISADVDAAHAAL